MGDRTGVLVIGAGQAGLVSARELVRRGLVPGENLLIVDGQEGAGGAWRSRWPSLTLGRTHGVENLPGLTMSEAITAHPSERASIVVSQYFSAYEAEFGLGVERPVRVENVTRTDIGTFAVAMRRQNGESRTVLADVVINATGTWGRPFVPFVPGVEDFKGQILHTRDFGQASDFAGRRVLVVGGGLSAVQMLLDIAPFAGTLWSTRRPPPFVSEIFHGDWGRSVETRVRLRTERGLSPYSVVRNTGIPPLPDYLAGIDQGILVSRGPIQSVGEHSVTFAGVNRSKEEENASAYPQSWMPYPAETKADVDVVFWNTGFRHDLGHLSGLRLREPGGGIRMGDEVAVAGEPGLFLVGYGSTASTRGAVRGGRTAAREAMQYLSARQAESA